MQNRSLLRLVILNFLTLRLYEYYWLSQTRQERVSKFGLTIPPFKRVLIIMSFQITCLLSVLAILFILVPYLNNKVSTSPDNPSPSFQCQYDTAAGRPVTDSCKQSINTYYGTASPKKRYSNYLAYSLVGMMGIILIAILSQLLIVRWIKHYAAGVAVVTSNKISKSRAINYLTLLPPTLGMVLVQAAYNETGAIAPQLSNTPQSIVNTIS